MRIKDTHAFPGVKADLLVVLNAFGANMLRKEAERQGGKNLTS